MTDSELDAVFAREDDCYKVAGDSMCDNPHEPVYEIRVKGGWHLVCYNAMAAVEVELQKNGKVLWCLTCGKMRHHCKCGCQHTRLEERDADILEGPPALTASVPADEEHREDREVLVCTPFNAGSCESSLDSEIDDVFA